MATAQLTEPIRNVLEGLLAFVESAADDSGAAEPAVAREARDLLGIPPGYSVEDWVHLGVGSHIEPIESHSKHLY